MGNQITNLTQAVAAAEIEVSDLRGEESKLHRLISERSNDIRQADEILAGPYRYPSHKEAQSARYAALRGRSEASNALISLQVDSNRVSIRLVELRRDLARAQYEAVSDADLKRVQVESISAIRSLDSQLADLQRDWVALTEKRDSALKVTGALGTAQAELIDAVQALETAQADAFIDGGKADIAGHTAKVTKAQKKVDEAAGDAVATRAALPRIAERLENLRADIERVGTERATAVTTYWGNRRRMLEMEYLAHASGLMDSLQSLLAIGQITGSDLGRNLLDKMRTAVFVPVEGKYAQALNTAPWFGDSAIPDMSNITASLRADLKALQEL